MATALSSSLFSKIVTAIMVLACLVAVFWVGSQVLEPIDVPLPPPPKARVRFDATVDVSGSPLFQRLRPLGPAVVSAGALGRVNPFVPLPTLTAPTTTPVTGGSSSTGALLEGATSTEAEAPAQAI